MSVPTSAGQQVNVVPVSAPAYRTSVQTDVESPGFLNPPHSVEAVQTIPQAKYCITSDSQSMGNNPSRIQSPVYAASPRHQSRQKLPESTTTPARLMPEAFDEPYGKATPMKPPIRSCCQDEPSHARCNVSTHDRRNLPPEEVLQGQGPDMECRTVPNRWRFSVAPGTQQGYSSDQEKLRFLQAKSSD